ncbi:DUF6538 domain-containing protein [Paraburkholderia sp. HD33-4]|uniref:DUF6538 domain-containing protein n=1 Tax=Paraburkholderia sp. HD33-4 TaxID=2883242 RepID=UPI001F3D8EB7|nr:DUF6538 domain-containing protein [Paraburkholderia sp. HD33-4]
MSVKLVRHPGGRSRNWYVDVSVPAAFQKLVSTQRVRRSTGTPDRTHALTQAARIEARLRSEWERLAAPPPERGSPGKPTTLTPALIDRICARRMADRAHSDCRRITEGVDDAEEAEIGAHGEAGEAAIRAVLAGAPKARTRQLVVATATEYAEQVGYIIEPDDPLLSHFVHAFSRTGRVTHEVIAVRNKADDAPGSPVADASGERLSAMVPVYQAHRKGVVDPKSVSKDISIWQRLIAFIGDVPLDDMTSGDLYRFLEDRLHSPDDGWSQGYVEGHAKRALRAIFALARTRGLMQADNPVDRLETTPKLPKKAQQERLKPRYPYSTHQLNVLFSSDWYDPSATHWRGKMGTDLAGRYWGPLVSTCHGARVREVVQVVNSDFTFDGDALLVTFQTALPDNDATRKLPPRTLKNAAACRTVPVHPKLLELGLGDFVRDMQAQYPPGTPLFPSAIPNPDGKAPLWGRAYEEAFLRHVRDTLAFGHGYGNHSFRHQLEDRVRDAQASHGTWPAGLGEFVSGRRLPRDADRDIFREQSSAIAYGNGFLAAHIQRFVAQIAFDGVVFPPVYREWLTCRTATNHQ